MLSVKEIKKPLILRAAETFICLFKFNIGLILGPGKDWRMKVA